MYNKEHIPENEQWKTTGHCEKCRRKEYCHTLCSAKKRRQEMILRTAMNNYFSSVGVSSDIISSMDDWRNL